MRIKVTWVGNYEADPENYEPLEPGETLLEAIERIDCALTLDDLYELSNDCAMEFEIVDGDPGGSP